MKKKTILFALLIGLIFVTGCGKAKEDKLDVKVNTNEDVIKDQNVDGLNFTNTSLTSVNGNWTLVTEVSNNTGSDYKLDEFTIIIKDELGNVIKTLRGYVGGVIPNGVTRTINSSTDFDLTRASKVEYEVKK